MFLGLTFEKVILIVAIAALLVGPERLPGVARGLAQAARMVRAGVARTTERARNEMGPEFDDVDWKRLDPRQFDPRRIIRDALLEPVSIVSPVPPGEPVTGAQLLVGLTSADANSAPDAIPVARLQAEAGSPRQEPSLPFVVTSEIGANQRLLRKAALPAATTEHPADGLAESAPASLTEPSGEN